MKLPDAIAVHAVTVSSAPRIDVNARTTPPRSTTATNANSANTAKNARPATCVAVLTVNSRWNWP